MTFDDRVMQAIADHRTAWADGIARGVMDLGNTRGGVILLVVVVSAVFVWLRAWRPALAALVALVVAALAADVLKEVFDRPRPPYHLAMVAVSGPSFPSTHAAATSAAAVAFVVAFPWASARAAQAVAICLGAAVVLVGACMVYLGAHWLTDVVAGWVVGGAIGYVVGRVFQGRPQRRRSEVAQPSPTSVTDG